MCRAGLGSRYFTEHGFCDWQAAVAADGHTLTSLGCDPTPVCHRPMKTCLFHPRVDGSDRGASTGGAAVPEPHGAAASLSPKDGEHPLVPGEEVAGGSRADGPCGRAVHPPAPALALAAARYNDAEAADEADPLGAAPSHSMKLGLATTTASAPVAPSGMCMNAVDRYMAHVRCIAAERQDAERLFEEEMQCAAAKQAEQERLVADELARYGVQLGCSQETLAGPGADRISVYFSLRRGDEGQGGGGDQDAAMHEAVALQGALEALDPRVRCFIPTRSEFDRIDAFAADGTADRIAEMMGKCRTCVAFATRAYADLGDKRRLGSSATSYDELRDWGRVHPPLKHPRSLFLINMKGKTCFKDKQLRLLHTARGAHADWPKGDPLPHGLARKVLDTALSNVDQDTS